MGVKIGTIENIAVNVREEDIDNLPDFFVPHNTDEINTKKIRISVIDAGFGQTHARAVLKVKDGFFGSFIRVGTLDFEGNVANDIRASNVSLTEVELVSFTNYNNLSINCSVYHDFALPLDIGNGWGMVRVAQPVEAPAPAPSPGRNLINRMVGRRPGSRPSGGEPSGSNSRARTGTASGGARGTNQGATQQPSAARGGSARGGARSRGSVPSHQPPAAAAVQGGGGGSARGGGALRSLPNPFARSRTRQPAVAQGGGAAAANQGGVQQLPPNFIRSPGTTGGLIRSSVKSYITSTGTTRLYSRQKNMRPMIIQGDNRRRIFHVTPQSGYCTFSGCGAVIWECGGASISTNPSESISNPTPTPQIQQDLGLPTRSTVWRRATSIEGSSTFHSNACNTHFGQTSTNNELVAVVSERAIFPNRHGYPDTSDIRNLQGSVDVVAFLRGKSRSQLSGSKTFTEADRQFIHLLFEIFEAGEMNLANGTKFAEFVDLVWPEFGRRCSGSTTLRGSNVVVFFGQSTYFTPTIHSNRDQRNLPKAGTMPTYQLRAGTTPERQQHVFNQLLYAIEKVLLESSALSISIRGSTTLNGPDQSWQALRADVGDENAGRSAAVVATLGLVDMMGPITQANDEEFPRNLDDMTPDWASLGVGAPPLLSYRDYPSSDCAVTTSFVQVMQILVNRHLLTPGEVMHSPRKMCAHLLGLDASDRHALQNVGGQSGNVGEYWPNVGYQWNLDNVDVATKRRAMRALFISLNMVIQRYYPRQIVDTVGDSTLQYGHDIQIVEEESSSEEEDEEP